MRKFSFWFLGATLTILCSGMAFLGCPGDTVTTGALIVQILPVTAVQAGAQWRVDAGDWQDSAAIVDALDAGTHVITFKTVSGWLTPPQQSILIQSGSTSAATGQYSISLTQAITQFANSAVDVEDAGDELFASFVRTTDLNDRATARTQLHEAVSAYLSGGGTLATLQQRSNAISTRFYSDEEVDNRYARKESGKHSEYDDWDALESTNIVVFVNGMNVGLPGFIEDSFALQDAIDSIRDTQDLSVLALWIPGFTPDLATLTAGDQALLQWMAAIPSGSGYATVLQDVAEHLLLLQATGHNVILVPYSAGNLPVLSALNAMTTERASFSGIETGSLVGAWPTGIAAHYRIDIANDPVAQLSAQYSTGNLLVRNSAWTIQDSLFYLVGKGLSTWSDTGALATLLTNHSFIGSYMQDSATEVIRDRIKQYCVPVLRSMRINSGASSTTDLTVALNNSCQGSPSEYMASESEDFSTNTGWKTYSASPEFTLSSGEGTKTVWFKVRSEYGRESAVSSDTITYSLPHPVLSVTPSTRSVTDDAGTTTFSVTNSGTGTMDWTAAVSSGDWLRVTSGSSGSNEEGESATVTISYDANTVESARTGTILVTSAGTTGSPMVVSVLQAALVPDQPILSVSPLSRSVTADSGTTTFAISNTGTGSMTWTATITSGSWLHIAGSSSNKVTISYDENTDVVNSRTGTIRISSAGATGSPIDVTVVQDAAESSSHPAGTIRTYAGIEFVWCPSGVFKMGSPDSETGHSASESPQHTVVLSRGFWMSRYECTQKQWTDIMGTNPSYFQGSAYGDTDEFPVDSVSYSNVLSYISKLNEAYPDLNFRLPTEAEWEYACRAGTTTRYYWGDDPNYSFISLYAWIADNGLNRTHTCGEKVANNWKLYDMSGNVQEWVKDWYGSYSDDIQTNPTGPLTGTTRVLRGGAWYYDDDSARSAKRRYISYALKNNYTGFRLAKY